jgi:SAP domain-containing new25
LKEELVSYCQVKGIKTTGGKFEIADRIVHYLKTGEPSPKKEQLSKKVTSTFLNLTQ